MFYTYVHIKASDGKVFYVGKGSGNRCREKHGRSKRWCEIGAAHGLRVCVVSKWDSEQQAFAHERELIRDFRERGFDLVNKTRKEIGASISAGHDSPEGQARHHEAQKRKAAKRMAGYFT